MNFLQRAVGDASAALAMAGLGFRRTLPLCSLMCAVKHVDATRETFAVVRFTDCDRDLKVWDVLV